MHKTFAALSLIAAGALAANSARAQARDVTGWFVNGGAGRANYHATADINGFGNYDLGSTHGTAGLINAGYRSQYIGFEAGYTNLGSISSNDQFGDRAKLSGDGWTFGMNGHFNPTEHWYISARAGGFLWKLHAKETYSYEGQRLSDTGSTQSLGWYAGVGTGYDINRHWSVGASFDYYHISKDYQGIGFDIGTRMFTVNAEYRF
jgi:OmpA-OmpF porin, OOP family